MINKNNYSLGSNSDFESGISQNDRRDLLGNLKDPILKPNKKV